MKLSLPMNPFLSYIDDWIGNEEYLPFDQFNQDTFHRSCLKLGQRLKPGKKQQKNTPKWVEQSWIPWLKDTKITMKRCLTKFLNQWPSRSCCCPLGLLDFNFNTGWNSLKFLYHCLSRSCYCVFSVLDFKFTIWRNGLEFLLPVSTISILFSFCTRSIKVSKVSVDCSFTQHIIK